MIRPQDSIRRVQPDELPALLGLMAEHAAFEGGEASAQAEPLSRALFQLPARLFVWVAWDGVTLLGYAAASREYGAWRGGEHLHMDCLFVSAAARNRGLGLRLAQAVMDFAAAETLAEVQWQTPAWNLDAVRFYQRLGAVGNDKVRFSLRLGDDRAA